MPRQQKMTKSTTTRRRRRRTTTTISSSGLLASLNKPMKIAVALFLVALASLSSSSSSSCVCLLFAFARANSDRLVVGPRIRSPPLGRAVSRSLALSSSRGGTSRSLAAARSCCARHHAPADADATASASAWAPARPKVVSFPKRYRCGRWPPSRIARRTA